MKIHDARHALPISNGWSGGSHNAPSVQCGRCRDSFEVDEDWANRYYDTQKGRVTVRGGFDPIEFRQLTEDENRGALAAIEEDRAYLIRLIRQHVGNGGS